MIPYPQPLIAAIKSPLRRALAWYANRAHHGGLNELNERARASMPTNADAVLVDIGTGDGRLTKWFCEKLQPRVTIGLDADSALHWIIPTSLEREFPIPSATADIVIASQIIEHIINTPLFLKETRRILRRGGLAFILTENVSSWANVAAAAMGWMPFSLSNMFGFPLGNPLVWHAGFSGTTTGNEWGCVGHQRLFSLRALKQLGERSGLRATAEFGGGYLPLYGQPSRWLSRFDPTHAHFIGVRFEAV